MLLPFLNLVGVVVYGTLVKGGWGNLSDTIVVATGSQLQTNIGEEGTEGEINAGWGRKTWNNNEGWGISGTLRSTWYTITNYNSWM